MRLAERVMWAALLAQTTWAAAAACGSPLECFCDGVSDGVWRGGRCYALDTSSKRTWDAAFDHCVGFPGLPSGSRGRLAHFDTDALLGEFIPPERDAWIGIRATEAHDSSASLSSFAWWDGEFSSELRASDCLNVSQSSLNWDPESDDCLKIKKDGKFDGRACDDNYYPFCEFLPEANVTYGVPTGCAAFCAGLSSAATTTLTTIKSGALSMAVKGQTINVECDPDASVGAGTHTYTCAGTGPSWSPTVDAECNPRSGPGWRHVVTLMAFMGFFFVYVLRVNLSVGLVAMLNHTAFAAGEMAKNESVGICLAGPTNKTKKDDGPFYWDKDTQGYILGAFFYGYIITQIPGGLVAQKYGAKWVFGLGTLWTSALTLLTPAAARAGTGWFIALRVLEGLGEGVTYPAVAAMYAVWAPAEERSSLPALAYSGAYVGTVFSFLASGYMCESDFLGGWPSVFYVFGTMGIVWFAFWCFLVSSTPETHRFISAEEKSYIKAGVAKDHTGRFERWNPPWGAVWTSLPFWAIIVSQMTFGWGFYTLLTELPSYLKDILGFDLDSNGVASSLPYAAMAIVQNVAGFGCDYFRRKSGTRDVTKLRKIVDCLGHAIPGVCCLVVGYVGCNKTAAVAILTISVGATGLTGAGFLVNHLDIAPQYAGVLFGITNSLGTMQGFLGPQLVGMITEDNDTQEAWRTVFFISAGLYFFSTVFYGVFASGKIQPWAEDNPADSETTGAEKDT